MGYKDKETERAYQREYKRKARAEGRYNYPVEPTEARKVYRREYQRQARAAGKYNYPRKRNIHAGYIYVILEEETGRHKIGVVLRNMAARLAAMQSDNSSPLRLIGTGYVDDVYGREKDFHTAYASKRVRGEWFQLTPEDVAAILEGIAPHDN